jgi:biopolymer transport protein ExbD
MKHLLCVSLFVSTLGVAPQSLAQAPEMTKGVSVQMATTSNAMPMPEADRTDAWIVAVTGSGQLYFGTQSVTPEELAEQMRIHPRNRESKLYINADARVAYASVKKALAAAKADLFDSAVLLTTQPETPALGTMVPPKGLEVMLAPASSSEPVVVQVLRSDQKTPGLKVDDDETGISDFQTKLNQSLQSRGAKVVLVKADSELPFAQVVHVIDACHSVGAKIILPTAEM